MQSCFVTIEYCGEEIYRSKLLIPAYHVTFNVCGGNETIDLQKFYEGEVLINRPVNPTRSGHVFTGWYFSEGYAPEQECKFDGSEIITEDKVLYARWENLKLLKEEDRVSNKYYDTTSDIAFIRFNMSASSIMKITWYENGKVLDGEKSTTLNYKPSEFGEYVIFCKVDNQQSRAFSFHYYQSPTEVRISRKNTTTLNKYEFTLNHNSDHIDMSKVKWYATDDLSNRTEIGVSETSIEYMIDKPYIISVEYNDGEHLVTYSYSRILPKYVVTYYIEGDKFTTSTVEMGTILPNHDRIKDGYILKCWYLDNYTYQNKWDFNTPVTETTNLYAKYVELVGNGNNKLEQYVMEVEQVNYSIELDEEVVWTVKLENEVYIQEPGNSTFSFTPEEGVNGRYTISVTYRGVESNRLSIDVIYYAPSILTINSINKSINIYDMNILGDEHVPSIHDQKLQWHKVVNYVDTIFATGHSLKDVLLNEPCKVYLEYSSGKVKVRSNEIVISPLYLVQFSSEGDIVHSENVLYNSFVEEIPEVTSFGKMFGGWYQDESYTTPYHIGVAITRNITIYAKWVGLELEDPSLSVQYVNSAEQVVLSIDIQGTIYWYQNGAYMTTTNVTTGKSIYVLNLEPGVSRIYYVRCEYYDSKTDTLQTSNTQIVEVKYYEPEEVLTSKTEVTRNNFKFEILDTNAYNMDPTKFDWYIEVNGNTIQLNNQVEGIRLNEYKTELILNAQENCVVYLKYNNEEVERYTIVPMYEITYITQVNNPEKEVVERYSTVTPSRVTRPDYIFAGWYTEYTCENKFNTNTEITSDLTLYAKWAQLRYLGSNSLLTQYLDKTERVQLYVDITGVSIAWYVNGNRQILSGSSEVFNYMPSNSCGRYSVTCVINGEESNAVVITVYAVPTELKISSSKNTNNEVDLSISDSVNINGDNCIWVKKNVDGTLEELGTGTTLSARVDENYEIFVVYRDTNVAEVVSNTLLLEKQVEEPKTNGSIWIILAVSVVVLGAVGVVVYLKVLRPRQESLAVEVEQPTTKPRSNNTQGKKTSTTKPRTTNKK
jgi:uncharacterized repeat protein (TIGR02543 family)